MRYPCRYLLLSQRVLLKKRKLEHFLQRKQHPDQITNFAEPQYMEGAQKDLCLGKNQKIHFFKVRKNKASLRSKKWVTVF